MASIFELTFLGTGTSVGVPMIGCQCETCRSTDPRDKRSRCSVLIKTPECQFVIDTGPVGSRHATKPLTSETAWI